MVAVNKFVGHAFRRDAENHTPEAYAPRTRMLPGGVWFPNRSLRPFLILEYPPNFFGTFLHGITFM